LAGVLATLLHQSCTEHHLGDLVFVARLAALGVADDGHIHLLQVVGGDSTLLD